MVAAEKEIKRKISYAEYLAAPEIEQRYEIIDGEMVISPAPTVKHQWLIGNLTDHLRPFVKKRKLGIVLSAPLDVLIRRHPLRTRQPDLLHINPERCGKSLNEIKEMAVLEVSPDLVVEILSPSDTRRILQSKIQDYIKIGVRECWIISPEAETVEVLELTSGAAKRILLLGAGDTLRSECLPGFKMKVDEIFI